MFGVSSVLIFAVVWLNLYVNINAHYDHMRHVPQYEGSPEAMGQDNVYSDLVCFFLIATMELLFLFLFIK